MKQSFLTLRCALLSTLLLLSQTASAESLDSKSLWVSISLPVLSGVYAISQNDNEGLKELAYASMFSIHLSTLLKNTVRRTRPDGGDSLSFPSGHSTAAFTGASFMHHRYGLAWGIPAYAIATSIAYERIHSKKHYWTDVLAGSALGWVSGFLFTARYPHIWLESDFDPENRAYSIQVKGLF